MNDITIIYLTTNELPKKWVRYQQDCLLEAIGDSKLISISKQPIVFGLNLLDQEPKSYWNMYMQILRACKIAKTNFIGIAEDDTLYTKTHFTEFRPPLDSVSYDRSRWSLFTWEKEPFYCLRQRISNCSLIASREYLIDALEERKSRYPQGPEQKLLGEVGRVKVDSRLGVSRRNMIEFYSYGPIVQLNHPSGTDLTQKTRWKRHGQIRAYDIPFWGKASEIVKIYGNT